MLNVQSQNNDVVVVVSIVIMLESGISVSFHVYVVRGVTWSPWR
jgi:hypothetical protein